VHDNIVNDAPEKQPAAPVKPREVHEGERYRHFKGGLYTVIAIATHTETMEEMVVYKSDENGSVWVRPKSMFLDKKGDVDRFVKLD